MTAFARWDPLIPRAAVLLTALSLSACDDIDDTRRKVIASSEQWQVVAVGDLDSPGRGFGRNLVQFEVARSGATFGRGVLYTAGPHDRSFSARYHHTDWVATNVLRFAPDLSPDLRALEITIRNSTDTRIRWLKIDTDELFLILDIPPRESKRLTTGRWANPSIALNGEFDDGRLISRSVYRVQVGARQLEFNVRNEGVVIENETRSNASE